MGRSTRRDRPRIWRREWGGGGGGRKKVEQSIAHISSVTIAMAAAVSMAEQFVLKAAAADTPRVSAPEINAAIRKRLGGARMDFLFLFFHPALLPH